MTIENNEEEQKEAENLETPPENKQNSTPTENATPTALPATATFYQSKDISTGMVGALSWVNDISKTQKYLNNSFLGANALQSSITKAMHSAALIAPPSQALHISRTRANTTTALFNNSVYEHALAVAKLPSHLHWIDDRRIFEKNTLLQYSIKDTWSFTPAQINLIKTASSLMVGSNAISSFNLYKTEALSYLQTNDVTKPLLECMNKLSGTSFLHVNKPYEALTARSLANVNFNNLFSRIEPTSFLKTQLTAGAIDFSIGYAQVSTQVISTEKQRQFYELSSKDYFLKAQVLEIMSRRDSVTEEKKTVIQHLVDESTDYIEKQLAEIDRNLLNTWKGAKYAINSENPDSARHFSTSVRELINHTLRILAPPEKVIPWMGEKPKAEYLDNNKQPTRAAKIDFICREASTKSTARYIESQKSQMIAFVNDVNGGTHGIEQKFTIPELKVFKAQIESNLLFLIRMNEGFNKA